MNAARESIKGDRDKDSRALDLLSKLRKSSNNNYIQELDVLKKVLGIILKVMMNQSVYYSKRERVKRFETRLLDEPIKPFDPMAERLSEKKTNYTTTVHSRTLKKPFHLIKDFEKTVLELFERDRIKKKNVEEDNVQLLDYSHSKDYNSGVLKPTFEYSPTNFCKKMKEIKSTTSRLNNVNKIAEDLKKGLPLFFDYQLKKGSFASQTTKEMSSTNNFRICSRSMRKGLHASVLSMDERSTPMGFNTTIGTERSMGLCTTRSQFMKKNSLPIVDLHIKKNRFMMRSSHWS